MRISFSVFSHYTLLTAIFKTNISNGVILVSTTINIEEVDWLPVIDCYSLWLKLVCAAYHIIGYQ